MPRPLLLGLLAALALPAAAQTPDSTATADPAMADTTMAADSTASAANPALARPLYDEGLALARAGQYDAALLKYEEALVNDPAFAPAAYGRATALAQLGRLADSRTAFETAVASARAADDADVLAASEAGLARIQTLLVEQAAADSARAVAEAANAAVQAQTDAIAEATAILNAETISAEDAQRAFDALERAREAGYDANLVAYYYAKALLVLDRGAEAVSFAQTALDVADPATDRSGLYVQLGRAQWAAGQYEAARASLEAAKTGPDGQPSAWAGWADHYLREFGDPPDPTNPATPQ